MREKNVQTASFRSGRHAKNHHLQQMTKDNGLAESNTRLTVRYD